MLLIWPSNIIKNSKLENISTLTPINIWAEENYHLLSARAFNVLQSCYKNRHWVYMEELNPIDVLKLRNCGIDTVNELINHYFFNYITKERIEQYIRYYYGNDYIPYLINIDFPIIKSYKFHFFEKKSVDDYFCRYNVKKLHNRPFDLLH